MGRIFLASVRRAPSWCHWLSCGQGITNLWFWTKIWIKICL